MLVLPTMRAMRAVLVIVVAGACDGASNHGSVDAAGVDGGNVLDAPTVDAGPPAGIGTVGNVRDLATCPDAAPIGATCQQVTVTGCPGIEGEAIEAIVAVRSPSITARGTVVLLSGGGGLRFQGAQNQSYLDAGLRMVHVAWVSDWEQTANQGIKTAACRPATILRWIFAEPGLHGGRRDTAFCGEGFSAGSGQLGYALAHYGLGDSLDYVSALSGPPFARIDLGCDGDAPATAEVCGTPNTMRLPPGLLNPWENIQPPLQCGSQGVPVAELARWRADSIAIDGVYSYPRTQVQFYACTNRATAVTAQGKLYFDRIAAEAGGDPDRAQYHCYDAADGCQGEGLGTGAADATQALIAGCVPRHP